MVEPRIEEEKCGFFVLAVQKWTSSLLSSGCLGDHPTSPLGLWTWRRLTTVWPSGVQSEWTSSPFTNRVSLICVAGSWSPWFWWELASIRALFHRICS